MNGITIITLMSYDYKYLPASIASYYDIADEIIIGLDSQRLSWKGNPFDLDWQIVDGFISKIDTQKKIRVIEDNFHADVDPLKNDTNERNFLSKFARKENWVVQIDADEIFLNAQEFKDWLNTRSINPHLLGPNLLNYNIMATWLLVFKRFGNKALFVSPANEKTPVATMLRGDYTACRWTAQETVLSPLMMLHYSWGRKPEEIKQKLDNWSHANDFDVNKYYDFWMSVDLENFKGIKDFHPVYKGVWGSLEMIELRPDLIID